MADLKTRENDGNVEEFLNKVGPDSKRKDSFEILELMGRITGKPPKMWGDSIIGFDNYHYKYQSGREGDFFKTGFSPRKQNITLYIMAGFEREKELMSKLGKFKTGKSCLYIKSLDDIDRSVLEELIRSSYKYMTEKYG